MGIRRGLFAVAWGVMLANPAAGADWSHWRGPGQVGFAPEKSVVHRWSPDGENLLWKSTIAGRTTPLVLGNRVYFNGPVGENSCVQERVVCLDADAGKVIWEQRFNIFHTEIVENRVGWTALAADPDTGNLYLHGTSGEFICLDRDGKVLWKHSLGEEYNRVAGYGGRLHTPIVEGDSVIISFLNTNWGNHARPTHRYVAFDKKTGAVNWWAEPGGPPQDTTYACPIVAVLGGVRTMVSPNGDGTVYGLSPRTGQTLWSFKFSKLALNSSPVFAGDLVYVTHSEENLDTTTMGRTACFQATGRGDLTSSGEKWRAQVEAGYSSPALANGRLYVVDNSAMLFCLDAATGKEHWRHRLGRVGKGSPVVTSDGVIYVGEQNGVFWILKDAGDKCEVLDRDEFTGPDKMVDELFGSPAVCNGRVYFMTRYGSYCLGVKGGAPESAAAASAVPRETEAGKATALRIVPADVTLAPGGEVKFSVHASDADGKPVSVPSEKPMWSIGQGLRGTIRGHGEFAALPEAPFQTGAVEVEIGGLKAAARVRVTPRLPIKVDFEQSPVGAPPNGWIGAPGKSVVVDRDGGKVLRKIGDKGKPSPVLRMRAYASPPMPAGYTVQADMLGTLSKRRFRPDMGLINARYELILLGQNREIELSRWRDEPVHALRHRLPFEMKTDVWYRVKLRVALEGDKAVVRGKVWPRDEAEPEKWTIELTDPCPNREGSPGIYAYANGSTDKSDGAEAFVDNFQVSAND